MEEITTSYQAVGYAESRIGGRAENQDTCAFTDTPVGLLVLVCDGMGGGPGGKTASMIAAAVITERMKKVKRVEDAEVKLTAAIAAANAAIMEATGQESPLAAKFPDKKFLPEGMKIRPELKGMGSTVAALLLTKDYALIAHVGDSRVYQLRGRKVVHRTTDHSRVMLRVLRGDISEEEARTSSDSNIITQALGHSGANMHSDVTKVPYLKGDRFVLCSDGVWGAFPQPELVAMLTSNRNVGGTVDNTVISVDDAGRQAGGTHDNLTLALIETTTNSTLPVKMNKTTKLMVIALAVIAAASIILNVILWCARPKSETTEPVNPTVENVKPVVPERPETQTNAKAEPQTEVGQSEKDDATSELNARVDDLTRQLDQLIEEVEGLKKVTDKDAKTSMINSIKAQMKGILPMVDDNPAVKELLNKAFNELDAKIIFIPSRCDGQINAISKMLRTANDQLKSKN